MGSMKYPQLHDYDYLSRSFGRFCWLADLAVWWKKRRQLTIVAELVPEPEVDAFTQSLEHFNNQIRAFPHVLEPYGILLGQAETQDEQQKIMWREFAKGTSLTPTPSYRCIAQRKR